jgi:hypothetical protein
VSLKLMWRVRREEWWLQHMSLGSFSVSQFTVTCRGPPPALTTLAAVSKRRTDGAPRETLRVLPSYESWAG